MVKEEKSFENISYLELWKPFYSGNGTICVILVEGVINDEQLCVCLFCLFV